jgi:hypothetical protein
MAKVATRPEVLSAFRMDEDSAVLKAVLANKKTPNVKGCSGGEERALRLHPLTMCATESSGKLLPRCRRCCATR